MPDSIQTHRSCFAALMGLSPELPRPLPASSSPATLARGRRSSPASPIHSDNRPAPPPASYSSNLRPIIRFPPNLETAASKLDLSARGPAETLRTLIGPLTEQQGTTATPGTITVKKSTLARANVPLPFSAFLIRRAARRPGARELIYCVPLPSVIGAPASGSENQVPVTFQPAASRRRDALPAHKRRAANPFPRRKRLFFLSSN